MIAEEVEPRVGLHVQGEVAELRLGQRAHQLLAHLGAVGGEADAGAVQRQVGDLEAGRAGVQLAPLVPREPADRADPLEVGRRGLVPLEDRSQPGGDVVLGVAEEREVGRDELGVGGVAVLALPVVLHHQLPVALLGQVDLVGDLGVAQLVRGQVGLDEAGHLVEVGRRVLVQADEDQAGDVPDVDGLEAETGAVEGGRLGLGEDQVAVGPVGPLVVGADDVADRAARLLEQPRAAVPADVVEGADLLVVVAQDDHRVRADVDRDVVAGVGDLRLGGAEQPVLGEDRRDIQVEHLLAGVEGRLQAVAHGAALDQGLDLDGGVWVARLMATLLTTVGSSGWTTDMAPIALYRRMKLL